MSSFQQETVHHNTPNTTRPSTPEPKPATIFTGEFRTPLRERVRHLPASLAPPPRPDTPIPNSRDHLVSPRTPIALPSTPECPDAPKKPRRTAASFVRQLAKDEDDEENILLDYKVNKANRRSLIAGSRSPLRQSWGPDEMMEIDDKLRVLLAMEEQENEMKRAAAEKKNLTTQ